MSFSRRRLLSHAAALSTLSVLGAAQAADSQPIRILVGFPPGGGSGVIARLLAEKLRDELGQAVIVENRPGAGGQIAAQLLKSAPADGHTLFLTHDHTISILPQVIKKPGFDPDQDFVPVVGIATFVNALAVSSQTPARNLAEYVAWVREQGGKSAVGIPAPASTPEFLVRQLASHFKLDLVAAPYRGSAPMLADMLGNQIPAGIGAVQDFIEHQRAGKMRVIAVLGDKRQAAMPEVATLAEQGIKGYEDLPYYGFYAPKGTPAAFIQKFSVATAKVLQLPQVHEQFVALGLTVDPMSAKQLAQREQAYTRTWAAIIRKSGYQPQ